MFVFLLINLLSSMPFTYRRILIKFGSISGKSLSYFAHSSGDLSDETYSALQASSLQNKFKNWQDLRRYKLTASTFGGAVGFWPGRRVQLWSEKIGAIEPFRENLATIWKNIRVEEALVRYMQITRSTDIDPAGFQVYGKANSEDDWLAASPDGVVGALPSRGVLEIKCPYFNGDMAQASPYKRVPLHYIPQAQGLMEIMDMEWMHFYVWTVKGSSLFRIYRDRNYWDGLLKIALSDFWWSHVQPAWCSNIKSEIEIQLLKPAPRHKLCSEIVYESKRIVDNSELLNRQYHGKLENDKTDGSCYFYLVGLKL